MMTVAHERAPLTPDARRYVDAASGVLDGLDVGAREELLSDVIDAIAELDGPIAFDGLVERLGAPEAFVRELADSAGLRLDATPASSQPAAAEPSAWHLRARRAADAGGALAEWSGRELEPLWWIVRALGVAWVLLMLGISVWFPFSARVLVVVLVAGSLILGARARAARAVPLTPQLLRLRGVGILLAVVFAAWLFLVSVASPRVEYVYDDPIASHGYGLLTVTGDEITNIYAFTPEGERIHDVRLYDQDGDPIAIGGADIEGTLPNGECCFATDDEHAGEGEQRFRVFDAARREQFNVFPIRYAERESGEIADPEAGWPARPKPLIIAPSIDAAQASDEIEAEVERRVAQELRRRGASGSSTRAKQRNGKQR